MWQCGGVALAGGSAQKIHKTLQRKINRGVAALVFPAGLVFCFLCGGVEAMARCLIRLAAEQLTFINFYFLHRSKVAVSYGHRTYCWWTQHVRRKDASCLMQNRELGESSTYSQRPSIVYYRSELSCLGLFASKRTNLLADRFAGSQDAVLGH